ncbi:hypothetical protein J8273_0328 [Carpediemonas membranifera]|uniref:ZZ-type domain-containing protein n=1 Tax=Carpediemonas membranifera TaxID=201153 RepID=A0A8J6E0H0_9EUKA|nr:hypothetical protein J8273_0328 [Carpediemonas membranifera]|eukprot:KAG9395109.1 hypothetical protein J8273_0328 [Carpediemonas membranifera]
MLQCDLDIEQLEELLNGDRYAVLEALPRHSLQRLYFEALAEQIDHPDGRTQRETDIMKELEETYGKNKAYQELQLRRALLSFDNPKDKKAHDTVYKLIDDATDVNSECKRHTKPFIARKSTGADSRVQHPMSLDNKPLAPTAVITEQTKTDRRMPPAAQTYAIQHMTSWWGKADEHVLLSLLDNIKAPCTAHGNVVSIIGKYYSSLDKNHYRRKTTVNAFRHLPIEQHKALAAKYSWYAKSPSYVSLAIIQAAPVIPDGNTHLPCHAKALDDYHDWLWVFATKLSSRFVNDAVYIYAAVLERHKRRGEYPLDKFLHMLDVPIDIFPLVVPSTLMKTLKKLRDGVTCYLDTSLTIPFLAPCESFHNLVDEYLYHTIPTMKPDQVKHHFGNKVDPDYLPGAIARAHLYAGAGDADAFTSGLSEAELKDVRESVTLEFDATPDYFPVGHAPKIRLSVKNLPHVTVNVYHINAAAVLTKTLEPVGPALDLDGFIPSAVIPLEFDRPPSVRHSEEVRLTMCKAGTHVVEVVGGSLTRRVLIQVDHLRAVTEVTPPGHVVSVFNSKSELANATVIVDGARYPAPEGRALIPFTRAPEKKPMVLISGHVATMATIDHKDETYTMPTGFYLERGELIPGTEAHAVIRPVLLLNGTPIPTSGLTNVRVTVTIDDVTQSAASTVVTDGITVVDGEDIVVPVFVPPAATKVGFTLTAELPYVSKPDVRAFSIHRDFQLHAQCHEPDSTLDSFLLPGPSGFRLLVCGKNGEVYPGLAFTLTPKSMFSQVSCSDVQLMCDKDGTVDLGALEGIASIAVRLPKSPLANDMSNRTHTVAQALPPPPSTLDLMVGRPLAVPMPWGPAANSGPMKPVLSMFRVADDVVIEDVSRHMALNSDMTLLTITPPAPGSYVIYYQHPAFPTVQRTALTVHPDTMTPHGDLMVGSDTVCELTTMMPHIAGLTADKHGTELAIAVHTAATTPGARIHVAAVSIAQSFDSLNLLRVGPESTSMPTTTFTAPRTTFSSDAVLSDEDKYILDRTQQGDRLGCLLPKPELLLHAREVADTTRKDKTLADGVAHSGRGERMSMRMAAAPMMAKEAADTQRRDVSVSWDHLSPSVVALNRSVASPTTTLSLTVPETTALVSVTLVDGCTVAKRVVRLEAPLPVSKDLRAPFTDPETSFAHVRGIHALLPGVSGKDSCAFQNWAVTSVCQLPDQAMLFQIMQTLGCAGLEELRPLLHWDALTEADKLALYARTACTELNLFLAVRDRPFFRQRIAPCLMSKLAPSAADDFLLGASMATHAERYHELNTLEKIMVAAWMRDQGDVHGAAAIAGDIRRQAPKQVDPQYDNTMFNVVFAAQSESTDVAVPPSIRSNRRGRRMELLRSDAKVYEEREYHGMPAGHCSDLFPVNAFWVDFAEHVAAEGFYAPFVSPHALLPAIDGSVNSAMAVLALTALPARSKPHTPVVTHQGGLMTATIAPATPAIVFFTEQRPAKITTDASILVRDSVFDPAGIPSEGQQRAYMLRPQVLPGRIVGIETALTNLTTTATRVHIDLRLPEGALPVGSTTTMSSSAVELRPFSTHTIIRFLYFPATGTFEATPAHVSRDGVLIARSARTQPFLVVDTLDETTERTWAEIAVDGTLSDIVDYLTKCDLARTSLEPIYHRCSNINTWDAIVDALTRLGHFDAKVWAFALLHKKDKHVRTWLQMAPRAKLIRTQLRPDFSSSLVDVNDVLDGLHRFLEYRPIINDRALKVGGKLQIDNDRLREHYKKHLAVMLYRNPAPMDLLATVYYHILLDREIEARKLVGRIQEHFDQVSAATSPVLFSDMPAPIPFRCDACQTVIQTTCHSCGVCGNFDLCDRCISKYGPKHAKGRHPSVDPASCFTATGLFKALQGEIQWDYCRAYLDFLDPASSLEEARGVVSKYRAFPIPAWRKRFDTIAKQLAEIDEVSANRGTDFDMACEDGRDDGRAAAMAEAASTEPTVALTFTGNALELQASHVDTVTLCFHSMDTELIFSLTPLFRANRSVSELNIVRPNLVQTVTVTGPRMTLPLPDGTGDCFVEALASRCSDTTWVIRADVLAFVDTKAGRIRVTAAATGLVIPKAYVKVYADLGGSTRFFRDGYTDRRGIFEYAAGIVPAGTRRFAILVTSRLGTVVKTADVPAI